MAQGLITLLSLCIVMATASFLAGILPLAFNLSASRLRLISTIGMGVLVGTSLIVIIPEGVDTLYGSNAAHTHRKRDLSVRHNVNWQHSTTSYAPYALEPRGRYEPDLDPVNELNTPGPVLPDSESFPPKTPTEPGTVGIMTEDAGSGTKEEEDEEAHHAWIGIALITGFILMFLIDKVPQYATTSKPRTPTHHIALNNLGRRFNLTTLDRQEEEAESFIDHTQPQAPPEPSNRSLATTIGLVIHAAADGIALGASSTTSNTSLSFIIFFAIMLHKAPAAFGLTSILLKQGLSKRMARAHLFVFSLAAPAGAFLTWTIAHGLGLASARSPQNSQWWTGVLLLFSAGTFLYVAMHAMQEITSPERRETHMNGHVNGSIEGRDAALQEQKPSIRDLGAAIFGMILPLFLQVGHAH